MQIDLRPYREFGVNIAIAEGDDGSEPKYENAIRQAAKRLRYRLGIERDLKADLEIDTIDGQPVIKATIKVHYG